MTHRWTRLGMLALLLALMAPLAAAAEGTKEGEGDVTIASEPPVVSLSNSFIRIDSDNDGQFVVGTTGGDPANPADDNRRLMFGFNPNGGSSIWSSFSTVRIAAGADAINYKLEDRVPSAGPVLSGGSIVTTWTFPEGVRVTQLLTPIVNPFSGRQDMVRISYEMVNLANAPRAVGVRTMLDVMVGGNDAAPYFVPGVGNSNREQEFTAANMPTSYTSFESATYAANSLKGQGLLTRGDGIVPPDRFVIASWARVDSTNWDYTINPASQTGDSATVMYWNPTVLQPNQSRVVATGYGLAGGGGGAIFSDTPILVPITDPTFVIVIWINNTTLQPFVNGTATLTLPPGLTLAAPATMATFDASDPASAAAAVEEPVLSEEVGPASTTANIGTVQPGTVTQVRWRVTAAGRGTYPYSVQAVFQSGTAPLSFQQEVRVGDVRQTFLPLAVR